MFLKLGFLLSGILCYQIDIISYYPNTEPIQKNALDYREYYGLQLINQLRVLLVSDEDADKASVALAVATGAQDDPAGIPGLAHYIEHVLYQGSRKYPNPYEFQEFLDANGGERNALTEYDRTVYHYFVDHVALEDSLDIFVDFFVQPKLGEAEVNGEASVIEYEYNRDMPFTEESFRHTSFAALNTSHPIANFTCGNYATLVTEPRNRGVDIRDLAIFHHHLHYSANRMSLVVIGKESIKELRNMVIFRFSTIPDINIPLKRQGSPFTRDNLAADVLISPESDDKEFRVHFALTPTHSGFYAGLEVLNYLFNLYLEKCLLKILEERGLADRIKITNEDNHNEFSIVAFNFGVTSQGLERKQEILKVLFAYIDAIKRQGINRKLYGNYILASKNAPADYDYPDDYAIALASRLNIGISFSDALYFFNSSIASESSSIMQVANQFNINNFIAYTINQFDGPSITEPWYGLNYTASKFTQPFLRILDSTKAEHFEIRLSDIETSNATDTAKERIFKVETNLLANNSIGTVKTIRLTPPSKTCFELELDLRHNPTPNLLAHILLLKEVMVTLFNTTLNNLPKRRTNHRLIVQGASILLIGNQESTQDVVSFVQLLKECRVTDDILAIAKERALSESLKRSSVPPDDAETHLARLIDPFFMDRQFRDENVAGVTAPQFKRFIETLFDSLKFNIICSDKAMFDSLVDLKAQLERFLGMDPTAVQYLPSRPLRLSHHSSYIYTGSVPQTQTLFYVHMYDAKEYDDYAMTIVATALFKSRFYHFMRTTKKVGYSIDSERFDSLFGGGIRSMIQSNLPKDQLGSILDSFLIAFLEDMQAMSPAKLKRTIAYLTRGLNQTLASPPPLTSKSWSKIKSYLHYHEKTEHAIQFLPTLTPTKFNSFLQARMVKLDPRSFTITIHKELT
ncbi:hypothetical protein DSO57_1009479 [Entomophthora muscae]|uniref:Uncharacterized protein n=1 Tax=Entomophthora muscae TaxID=34485 RepID=A0ACC2UFS1_9FUNG|nr:hypothetical protein DSO57_1009479 [Entomophthora muscae]